MKLQKHPISRQLSEIKSLKRITSALLSMSLLLCTGCTDDFEPVIPTSGEQIEFAVSTSNGWTSPTRAQHTENPSAGNTVPASRGTLKNSMADYDSFCLFAGTYDGDAWNEDECSVNYLQNVECRHVSGDAFSPVHPIFWPLNNQNIYFFAYAPYNLANSAVKNLGTTGSPELTYTVTSSVGSQQDLAVASCDGSPDSNGRQTLNFDHILTAIRFVAADDIPEGSIKSISIKGVYSKATTKIGSNDWSDHSLLSDYTLEFSFPIEVGTSETAGVTLTDDANTFIMMPQTLPEGACIELEFIDIVDIERTFVASISGTVWAPGTIVTYAISPNLLYILDVSPGYHYKPMF